MSEQIKKWFWCSRRHSLPLSTVTAGCYNIVLFVFRQFLREKTKPEGWCVNPTCVRKSSLLKICCLCYTHYSREASHCAI